MQPEMKLKAAQILNAICDTIIDVAKTGIPSGSLYAQLMPTGISLEQYETIISALVEAGRIKISNNYITAP